MSKEELFPTKKFAPNTYSLIQHLFKDQKGNYNKIINVYYLHKV